MLYLNSTLFNSAIAPRLSRAAGRSAAGRGRGPGGVRAAAARFLLRPMGVASEASAIRSGVRFSVAARGPLRRVPGPGTPAALPARHTATALTPPQPSWMRSRCPAVRTLHYAEPMRCCDLPRCLHSQAHVCPSHGLATPSHRRVPRATPRCPATCLTSRARAYAATRQECMRLPGLPLCSHGKPPYASPHANVMLAARHP